MSRSNNIAMVSLPQFVVLGVLAGLFSLATLLGLGVVAGRGMMRDTLWRVVRSCVGNYSVTGLAFPCLAVDLTGGEAKGWVVLRPPIGDPDTILAPTARIIGVEDPKLQDPGAANYFASAWSAREFVPGEGAPLASETAVVVNSKFSRTQDQLHLHIGCLNPTVRANLRKLAPGLSVGVWTRDDRMAPGWRETWVLRTGLSDAHALQPFRRVYEIAPDTQRMARLLVAVATAPTQGRDEFVIIAVQSIAKSDPGAEEVVEPSCSR